MFRKIIAIACALLLTLCTACMDNSIESESTTSQSKETQSLKESQGSEGQSQGEISSEQNSDSQETSDLQKLLRVIKNVEEANSFYTVAEGVTKSLGVNQKISAKRYVIGNLMFKESVSYSKLVKVANQTLATSNKYLVRESKKIYSCEEVVWDDSVTEISQEEYLNRYGSVIYGFNNYLISEQTVLSVTLTYGSDYEFVVTLDPLTATKNIVKEMKTNAGSSEEPTFKSIKMTVKADLSLQVLSVKYECEYSVKIPILGAMDCVEDMTEYYYGFNQTKSYPQEEIFSNYL